MTLNDISVQKWLKANGNFTFEETKEKVVAIHAFQMLCPGCILHGIPQAKKLHDFFDSTKVAVLGLHTVFEHHEAMQETSLKAFMHEFRILFPVGIDQPTNNNIPKTMETFSMRGTPTWIVFDKTGALAFHAFGQIEDSVISSIITQLCLDQKPADTKILKQVR